MVDTQPLERPVLERRVYQGRVTSGAGTDLAAKAETLPDGRVRYSMVPNFESLSKNAAQAVNNPFLPGGGR